MSRILVVDDDAPMRVMLEAVLTSLGHEVSLAANGREALALLRDTPPDLLLTDIFMPEMEGIETIRQIQRLLPHIPIIAMSGGAPLGPPTDYLVMARRFGARQVLAKPFSAAQLSEALSQVGLKS